MIVCAARINSFIGSKHHPGEKKILDTNNCFPAFLGLTFVLSKSLRNHSRYSEEKQCCGERIQNSDTKILFAHRLEANTHFGSYVEYA